MKFKTVMPYKILNVKANSPFNLTGKVLIAIALLLIAACGGPAEQEVWTLNCEGDASEACAYVDANGETMVDCEKYLICFSETFDNYAIVGMQEEGIVAINRQEEVLYQVFVYDNGPDYPSDGYFRIIQDGKIGYADAQTGAIKIKPQYTGAKPFEYQYAPVCPNCDLIEEGDHTYWANGKWGLIDKSGTMIVEPQYDDIIEISNEGEALVILEGEEKRITIE